MKRILIIILICSSFSYAQDTEQLIKDVNKAVDEIEYLHIKTEALRKYYTDTDTTTTLCDSWIRKTEEDTVLGMHIRSVSLYDGHPFESIHREDTISWFINGNSDTITQYNLRKGEWDCFNGNIKTAWTIETPLSVGIRFGEDDSMTSSKLDNGHWLIVRNSGDWEEYGMMGVYRKWWVDDKTLLPYRTISGWRDGDRETYNEVNIQLVSTDKKTVEAELYKELPDYPIVKPIPYDPEKYKPHDVGVETPEMKGILLKDSSEFDLAEHADAPLILIDFWYQTCGPCIRAVPYLDSLEHEFADKGLRLFEVNSRDHKTSREVLRKVISDRGGNPDNIVMIDYQTESKIWKSYANPTFYLVKEGKIVWVQQGFGPELMPNFREAIAKQFK